MKHSSYWESRKNLHYYKVVLDLAMKHCSHGQSLLDVGAANCEYISWFTSFIIKTRVDIRPTTTILGTETVQMDFMNYSPSRHFDLVLCLQVLEHLENPTNFCVKLLEIGKVVIISVPYKWPKGKCQSHVQDPVDELKLLTWLGKPWRDSKIVKDGSLNRLIVVL